jgi:hypothetical protein
LSFNERITKLGKDLGGAALSPFKLVWDVATSAGNNAEEFNGISNILKNSVGNFVKSAARPIGDVLSDIDAINRTVFREPLGTASLAALEMRNNGTGFNEAWQKAWEARSEISLGQSLAANIFSNTFTRNAFVNESEGANLFNEFDIFNKEDRDKVFKQSLFGRVSSGSLDFTAQLFGDVTLIGGKIAKGVRLGEKGIRSLDIKRFKNADEQYQALQNEIKLVTEAQDALRKGIEPTDNKFLTPIRNYRDNGYEYALSTDFVKSSKDPGSLALLLGESKTDDEVAFVMRAALGDSKALTELQTLRPSHAAAMRGMLGEFSEAEKAVLAPLVDPQTGQILDVYEHPNVVAEVEAEYQDLYKNNDFFRKFVDTFESPDPKMRGVGTSRTMVTRTFGTSERYKKFEDFIAKGRTTRLLSISKSITPSVEYFQPTRWNRAYARVTWAAGERPAYIANLNNPDSYQEILASVTRARKIIGDPKVDATGKMIYDGFSVEDANRIVRDYTLATTPEQRSIVILKLEEEVVNKVAQKHGISAERAKTIFDGNTRARQSSLASFKQRGYGLENGDLIKVPIYESQTANHMPIMNFDVLDKSIQTNLSVLKGPLDFKNGIVDIADVMQDMFKVGTLLRLGYTQRNAVDSQLRIMAIYGPMIALRNIPRGMNNLIANASTVPARLVDNIKVWRGRETKSSYRSRIDVEAKQLGRELGSKEKELKQTVDEIARIKAGPVIPPYTGAGLFREKGFDPEDIQAIKLGNEATLKRITEQERKAAYSDPLYTKPAEDLWNQSLPGGDQVNNIEKLITNKVALRKFQKDGEFPAYILRKFYEKDKYGNFVKLRKNDPLMDYSIEDIQTILYPDLEGIGRVEIGPGEIEQLISSTSKSGLGSIEVPWYPSANKKAQFIDDYITNQVNDITPEWVKRYILEGEKSHTAKYLQEWGNPDTSELYGMKQHLTEEFQNLKLKYDSLVDDIAKIDTPIVKKTIGQEDIVIPSKFGEEYTSRGSQGLGTELNVRDVSNAGTYEAQTPGFSAALMKNMEYTGQGTITPDMPNYYEAMAETQNRTLINSPAARFLLRSYKEANGDWDKAAKRTEVWLKRSGEGKASAKRLSPLSVNKEAPVSLGLSPDDIPGYVQVMVNNTKNLIPEGKFQDDLIDRIVNRKVVTPTELRKWYPDTTALSPISGRKIEEDFTRNITKSVNKWVNKAFKLLGTIPEDKWARFPLYDNLYRHNFTQSVMLSERLKGGALTSFEMNNLMKDAHVLSVREVNKILYTVVRKSNLGSLTFIRMISPFFGAQENAIKTWTRIVGRNPVVLNRAQLIWTAPNRAGFVTDKDGKPIEQNQLSSDGTIWLEVPKPLQHLPGLNSLNQAGISKKSLDIVFGGGFELPVGPYVAIPASEIVKKKPELEESLKWALPFGPERNAAMAMIPTWMKRQIIKTQGEDSPEYARAYQLIWTTEQHKSRENGTPYKTPQEIEKMVKAYYNMRTIANLVLPFSPRFDSPYRMHMDMWREYQRKFGKDADEMFLKDHEEFFDLAVSLSQNTGGVQASVDAVAATKANKELVSKLYETEPALIGLVVNNPTGYDFSQAAYEWQYATPITPGSKQTFRGTSDPAEVQRKNEASKGWIQYRQFMSTQIEPVLLDRGISSIRDRRAKDLAAMREDFIIKLGENEAWRDDWLDTDGSKTGRVIRGLERILDDKKFMEANANNPTWKSVALYIQLRDKVASQLAERKVKSLGAKANIQIAQAFDAAVGQLKQQDIGFSDLYDRFLSNDLVYDKFTVGQ